MCCEEWVADIKNPSGRRRRSQRRRRMQLLQFVADKPLVSFPLCRRRRWQHQELLGRMQLPRAVFQGRQLRDQLHSSRRLLTRGQGEPRCCFVALPKAAPYPHAHAAPLSFYLRCCCSELSFSTTSCNTRARVATQNNLSSQRTKTIFLRSEPKQSYFAANVPRKTIFLRSERATQNNLSSQRTRTTVTFGAGSSR
jgi:hypothetical protein